jgi:HSP20 family protein
MPFVKIRPFYPQGAAVKTFNQVANELMHRSLSEIVGNDFTTNLPAVNIIETDAAFILELAVPGLAKEEIKLQAEKNLLTISAIGVSEKKEDAKDTTPKYLRHEFNYRSFSRSFQLPESVDIAQISAKYEAGILQVTLLKKTTAVATTRVIVIE